MAQNNFDHLTVPYPKKNIELTDWNASNPISLFIKKKLASSPSFEWFFSRLVKRSIDFLGRIENQRTFIASLEKLKKDSDNAYTFGSNYGYQSEIKEFNALIDYAEQLKNKKAFQNSESERLYHQAEKTVSQLLSSDPHIKYFMNMGVCYAYLDSILAKKFPKIHFIGIDRSPYTKAFNENKFSQIKNMEFLSGDVFGALEKRNVENGIFFHSRTFLFLSKKCIEKIYEALFASNIKYIIGMEQVGISRQTKRPYIFSEDDQESVVYRSSMFIHNYPEILKKCGFRISEIELLKTGHAHEDYGILSFTAISQKFPS